MFFKNKGERKVKDTSQNYFSHIFLIKGSFFVFLYCFLSFEINRDGKIDLGEDFLLKAQSEAAESSLKGSLSFIPICPQVIDSSETHTDLGTSVILLFGLIKNIIH